MFITPGVLIWSGESERKLFNCYSTCKALYELAKEDAEGRWKYTYILHTVCYM